MDLRVEGGIAAFECGVECRELSIDEFAVAIEDLADVAPDAQLAVLVFSGVGACGFARKAPSSSAPQASKSWPW
jgi:hypothetical protein